MRLMQGEPVKEQMITEVNEATIAAYVSKHLTAEATELQSEALVAEFMQQEGAKVCA